MFFGDNIDWDHHVDEILGGKYSDKTDDSIFYPYRKEDELTSHLKKYVPAGSKILDCGCHIGRWSRVFSGAGYIYEGVDQSEKALEVAEKNNPQLTFFHSFLWDLDIHEEYDAAVFVAVLQHNTHPEKYRILPRIYDLLKPGGFLLMTESTVLEETKTQLTHQGWIDLLDTFGFELVETWHVNHVGQCDYYIFRKI